MVSRVVSTDMVSHLWAQQEQDSARTSIPSNDGGHSWRSGESVWSGSPRTWFRGEILYSYHEPIARFVRGTDGAKYALISAGRCEGDRWNPADYRKWSVATSNHMPGRSIDSHVAGSFSVPSIAGRAASGESHGDYDSNATPADVDHALNLEFLRTRYHNAARSFGNVASVSEWSRVEYSADGMNRAVIPVAVHVRASLVALWNDANEYQATFGVPNANPWATFGGLPWPESREAVEAIARPLGERLERLEAARNTPEAIAKREASKAKAKATKERRERLRYHGTPEERLAEWRAGASLDVLRYDEKSDATGGARLRVKGKTLETSHGAKVPLADAIKVFRFVKLCRDRGEGWKRNGARVRVGAFNVDSVEPSGDFNAGCHRINWPEIVSAAAAAGVLDMEPSAEVVTHV